VVWLYRANLSTVAVEDLLLPFHESTFQWADWSEWENGRIDLHAIE
jgi:hypothetical protein